MAASQSNAAIEVEVRAKKMSGGESAQQSDGTGHSRADGTVVVETRPHCAVSDEASEADSRVIEDVVRGCINSTISYLLFASTECQPGCTLIFHAVDF
jgi:hypothetical protein